VKKPPTWKESQKRLIERALKYTGGNKTRTADALGISLRSLRMKINEFGLLEWKGFVK
jgi:two-component system response regulator FlrC